MYYFQFQSYFNAMRKFFTDFNLHFRDIPEISHLSEIRKIFSKVENSGINWTRECDTFPLFVQLLQFPEFTRPLLSAFIRCAGSVTESLVSAYFCVKSTCFAAFQIFIGVG